MCQERFIEKPLGIWETELQSTSQQRLHLEVLYKQPRSRILQLKFVAEEEWNSFINMY